METSLTRKQFADDLLAIARSQTRRDPFLEAVCSGQIGRAGLKLWSLQALLFVRDFTDMLIAIRQNCPHADAKQLLAENIREEQGCGIEGQDHYSLLKRLSKSLGATDEEIDEAAPLLETAEYLEYCRRIARESHFVDSMTAIGVGIEFFIPKFFGRLAEALRERLALPEEDLAYLQVHVSADEDHARRALELIDRYADTPERKDSARETLREMLAVKDRFADAVFSHCARAGSDGRSLI
jgi:pyrroloquinoline quinone (PQQ) biosynthesis protein C